MSGLKSISILHNVIEELRKIETDSVHHCSKGKKTSFKQEKQIWKLPTALRSTNWNISNPISGIHQSLGNFHVD